MKNTGLNGKNAKGWIFLYTIMVFGTMILLMIMLLGCESEPIKEITGSFTVSCYVERSSDVIFKKTYKNKDYKVQWFSSGHASVYHRNRSGGRYVVFESSSRTPCIVEYED